MMKNTWAGGGEITASRLPSGQWWQAAAAGFPSLPLFHAAAGIILIPAAAWNQDDPLQLIPGVFDRLTGDISYSRRARVVFQTDMSNINRMLYSHYCKVCLYEYVNWHSKLDTNFFGTTSASFVAACFLSFSINLKENKKLNFKVVDVLLFFLAKIQNCFYVL